MTRFLLAFIVLFTFTGFSQENDSLIRNKFLTIRQGIERNPSKIKPQIQNFEKTAKKPLQLALAKMLWGQYYFNKDSKKSALYFTEASSLFHKIKDKKGIVMSDVAIAAIKYVNGDYKTAIQKYQEALANMDPEKEEYNIANINNNIASVFLQMDDYKKSLSYYRKALEGYRNTKDTHGIILDLYKIGTIYFNMKRFQEVSSYLDEAESLAVSADVKSELPIIYQKQGDLLYERDKDYKGAIEKYQKGIKIVEELGDQCSEIFLLSALADCQFQLKQYSRSESTLKKALKFFDICDYDYKKEEVYREMFTILYAQKKYDEAVSYLQMADSVFKELNLKEITLKSEEVDAKYQSAEKDKKIAENKLAIAEKEQKLAKQQRTTWIVIAVLLVLSGITVVLVYFWKKQKNINQQLEEIRDFDDLLYKIIGHDLRSMIGLNNYLKSEHEIQQNTRNILFVLDGLLEWRKSDFTEIHAVSLEKLIDELEDEFGEEMKRKNILVERDFQALPEIRASEKAIQTILRNILANALKYAPENSTVHLLGDEHQLQVQNAVDVHAASGTKIGHTIIDVLSKKSGIEFRFTKDAEKAVSTLTVIR